MANLLLIHGGLWEEGMDAARFWRQPGIAAGLERRGFDVFAPDRHAKVTCVGGCASAWPLLKLAY